MKHPPQRGLFDSLVPPPPPPAARHRPTSVAAAEEIQPRRLSHSARVLAAIQAGPKTDQEIAEATNLPENSVRPRRVELEQAGRIRDSEKTRRTHAGRRAIVWEAVEPTQT
jgi:predicted ArsR family transcriptional regulator